MAAQAAQIKDLQSQLGANAKLGAKIDKLAEEVKMVELMSSWR